jgi:two-component system sensor histidine kinase KdpD
MRAYNNEDGGACFECSLPLGDPPPLPVPDPLEIQEP